MNVALKNFTKQNILIKFLFFMKNSQIKINKIFQVCILQDCFQIFVFDRKLFASSSI